MAHKEYREWKNLFMAVLWIIVVVVNHVGHEWSPEIHFWTTGITGLVGSVVFLVLFLKSGNKV